MPLLSASRLAEHPAWAKDQLVEGFPSRIANIRSLAMNAMHVAPASVIKEPYNTDLTEEVGLDGNPRKAVGHVG